MRYLLDTNALIYSAQEPWHISKQVAEIIQAPEHNLYTSIVSLWEITIKTSLKKLKVHSQFIDRLLNSPVGIIPIDITHLNTLQALPHHHKDPFDRLIIAQAMSEKLTLITSDKTLQQYDVDVILAS